MLLSFNVTVHIDMACERMRLAVAALLLLLCGGGCGSTRPPRVAEAPPPITPPSLPERPSFQYTPPSGPAQGGSTTATFATQELKLNPGTRGDAVRTVESYGTSIAGATSPSISVTNFLSKVKVAGSLFASGGGSTPASSSPSQPTVAPPTIQAGDSRPNGERMELEAQFAIAVRDARRAAQWVRDLVVSSGGQIATDNETSGGGADTRIELLVRVPSSRFDTFSERLAQVGTVQSRHVKAVDAGPEERDLQVLIANLDVAIERYKALLEKATTTADALVAEREIERASADRDRIRARLTWLRDRIARATIAIALAPPPKPRQPGDDDDYDRADASNMHIGLRPLALFDVRESGTDSYAGGGFTFRLRGHGRGRGFPVEVDMLRACCGSEPARSRSGFMAQTGWDMWTKNFESAKHRWLLPYAGVRVGFAMLQDRPDFLAGIVAGIDVFRSSSVSIGLQARGLLAAGNPDGPHFVIQPALTAELGL